jgi:hypothetical protein
VRERRVFAGDTQIVDAVAIGAAHPGGHLGVVRAVKRVSVLGVNQLRAELLELQAELRVLRAIE